MSINGKITKVLAYTMGFIFVSVSYQNCGSFNSDNGGAVQASADLNGDIIPLPNTKTASVLRASRVLDSMVSCLGTVKASNNAQAEMDRNRGTISEEGLANTMTQPMAKSLVSVSAQVCNDLINKERDQSDTERIILKGVDMGSGGFNAAQVTNVVKRISRSCWGRNPSEDEISQIVSSVGSQFSDGDDNGQNTTNKIIYLCTAMASSFATYEM